MHKRTAYNQLVADRKVCQQCRTLTNPASIENGNLDSNEIGPWSRWQGCLDAMVMVVGQDWGDIRYFEKNNGLEAKGNPTNDALRELMGLLGIEVGPPGDSGRKGVAFFTNAVLCLKKGGLQSTLPQACFDNCGSFLRRQVEILQPRLLVCLGERAFRSVAREFGFRAGAFREAVESNEGITLSNGTRCMPRYHCGKRIQNTHRPMAKQREDWRRLSAFLE